MRVMIAANAPHWLLPLAVPAIPLGLLPAAVLAQQPDGGPIKGDGAAAGGGLSAKLPVQARACRALVVAAG